LFYLNHASYIFEILKFDSNEPAEFGELGRIVITDLYNYAFPIIRYDTGDIGKFEKPNEYSNGYPVLAKLYGRRYDLIYTTDCSPIHPITFGRELKHYSEIVQWQFIQKAEKEYILNVQLRANKLDEEDVINQLKNIVGSDSEIAINYVDDIPVLSSGKRKPVVNEWKNGK
jgi:phenylacetate-CoA ligase